MLPTHEFSFRDPGALREGTLSLVLEAKVPADLERGWVPYYHFALHLDGVNEAVGTLNFRAVITEQLTFVGGYIGYTVFEKYRGNHLAERACRLLLPFIKEHGFEELWVTCNPDNMASRRTLERLGASLVDVVDVPETSDMYAIGERQKCRYRLELGRCVP